MFGHVEKKGENAWVKPGKYFRRNMVPTTGRSKQGWDEVPWTDFQFREFAKQVTYYSS